MQESAGKRLAPLKSREWLSYQGAIVVSRLVRHAVSRVTRCIVASAVHPSPFGAPQQSSALFAAVHLQELRAAVAYVQLC